MIVVVFKQSQALCYPSQQKMGICSHPMNLGCIWTVLTRKYHRIALCDTGGSVIKAMQSLLLIH